MLHFNKSVTQFLPKPFVTTANFTRNVKSYHTLSCEIEQRSSICESKYHVARLDGLATVFRYDSRVRKLIIKQLLEFGQYCFYTVPPHLMTRTCKSLNPMELRNESVTIPHIHCIVKNLLSRIFFNITILTTHLVNKCQNEIAQKYRHMFIRW